jgi:hypothetical protein
MYLYLIHKSSYIFTACSAGWLPTSQQCFSLTSNQHQPLATCQPAVFFLTTNQHQPPATSQPNKLLVEL